MLTNAEKISENVHVTNNSESGFEGSAKVLRLLKLEFQGTKQVLYINILILQNEHNHQYIIY